MNHTYTLELGIWVVLLTALLVTGEEGCRHGYQLSLYNRNKE
jgi:hypothetical protein